MKSLLLLALAAVLAAIPAPASGCAVASSAGERIEIASESAIIVWDEANKIEHFIRRATFQSSAYDFGFLVPSPSVPEVKESDDEALARLERMTRPRLEHRNRTASPSFGCGGASAPKGASEDASSGVLIYQQQRVGDHDIVTVGFDSTKGDAAAGAAELAHWLVRFGYAFGDNLKDWIEPYVRNKWVVTAFRIAGEKPAGSEPAKGTHDLRAKGTHDLRAKAVRMSFKTERPFYPYREPADQRDHKANFEPRLLKVFFVADKRYAGRLGDGSTAWPGRTVWADKLNDTQRTEVATKAKLPAEVGPKEWFVTEFEDRSSPRPGTDEVYFAPSSDQSTVARTPIIVWHDDETPWLIGLAFCFGLPALVLVGLVLKRVWKRREPIGTS